MHRGWTTLLLAALTLAAYGVGVYTGNPLRRWEPPPGPDGRQVIEPVYLAGSGRVQPADDILYIGGIPGDRIKTLFVKVNDRVAKGMPLVEFASRAERERELELASRQVANAKARLDLLADSRRKKLAELKQQAVKAAFANELKVRLDEIQMPAAREGAKYAAELLAGLRSLDPTRALVVAQDMQKAVVEAASARARSDSAAASLEAARRQAELDRQVFAASAESVEAEFELSRVSLALPVLEEQQRLAELRYQRGRIVADSDARVLRVLGREGGAVGQEPILQLTTTEEMVVIAEVDVASVKRLSGWVETGRPVRATMKTEAFEGELTGTVKAEGAIAPGVARNAVGGFSPRADADRRVVEVRVELDRESSEKVAKFVGLEVNVKFHKP
jgi:HlyD family secretion protein